MIYFIVCPKLRAVKIGSTTQRYHATPIQAAIARLASVQAGCPLPLELATICEGGPAEEAALHLRFAAHRMKGEWFKITPDIRAHIAKHPRPPRPQPYMRKRVAA